MTLPAFAAERVRRVQAVCRHLLQATAVPRWTTTQPYSAAAVNRRDRQTDGYSTVA